MRKVKVEFWDDLDWADSETLTEAKVTVTVGLNGTWRELDLSESHHADVVGTLGRLMKAGRVPGKDDEPGLRPPGRQPSGVRSISPETLAEGRAMRAFAQEHGIRYITKTGKYYYSVKLRQAWDQRKQEMADRVNANGN